jgi:hypothetical protein
MTSAERSRYLAGHGTRERCRGGPALDDREQIKPERDARKAAYSYRHKFALPARFEAGRVLLPLTGGIAAVSAPAGVVAQLLLQQPDVFEGPVVLVPADQTRAFVLVEPDGLVVPQIDLPAEIGFHSAPETLVLPPSGGTHGPVSWLRSPLANRRWLPSATGALAALVAGYRSNELLARRTAG